MNNKVALVIPCFNEEKRLNLNKIQEFSRLNPHISIYFVDDGSKDNTFSQISSFIKETNQSNLFVCSCSQNVGKAEAIRFGLKSIEISKYDYFGYWDADLSTPLETLNEFLKIFEQRKELLLVSGSRIRRMGTNIERNLLRHIAGRVFATFASLALDMRYYDTQCGAKIFNTKSIGVFSTPFYSKWLFDIELLFRMKKNSREISKSIYEHPLEEWVDYGNSRVNFLVFLKAPFELLMIYLHYRE